MEGQPISILEALASGNIVLTTKQGGIPDIFQNGVKAFFLKKNSPEDIALKLEKISYGLKQLHPLIKKNAIEVRRKYTLSNYLKSIGQLILDILN